MALVFLVIVVWVAFFVLGVVYMIFEPLLSLLGRGVLELVQRLRRRIFRR